MSKSNEAPKTIGEFFAAHPDKLTAFVEDFSAFNASMRRFVALESLPCPRSMPQPQDADRRDDDSAGPQNDVDDQLGEHQENGVHDEHIAAEHH